MKTYPIITFGPNALTISNDAEFSTNDVQPFANLEDLSLKSTSVFPFATYEPNRYWLLDGNFKFLSDDPHTGYVSASMSDHDGEFPFGAEPKLTITFDDVHSTNGLTLHFSILSNNWVRNLNISFYDSSNSLIRTDNYNPTSTVFKTNQAVANFKKIEIEFLETNWNFRYVRLSAIDFDDVAEFAGANVLEASMVEQIDPIVASVPIGTVRFKLFSSTGDFNIVEPAGIFVGMQEGQPIDVREVVDGDVVFLGRYYIEKWESLSVNIIAIEAHDAIGVLEKTSYLGFMGGVTPGITLVIHGIAEIFQAANLDYEIDSFWNTFGVDQHLPPGTAREALHQCLFQLYNFTTRRTAVPIAARSNKIRILALYLASALTSYDHVITNADQAEPELSLKPIVTDVQAFGYSRMTEPDTITIFNASLPVGEKTIIFDGPMDDLSVTGATITTEHVNYAVLDVASPGSVVLTGKRWVMPKVWRTVHNDDAPAGTPTNLVIADGSLVAYPNNTMLARANISLAYYKQRYVLKTTLFAMPHIVVGDSVVAEVQGGRQLAGIVEKMETDLAGGFVSRVEIVGIILPE